MSDSDTRAIDHEAIAAAPPSDLLDDDTTAAGRVMATLRALSSPDEDAGDLELMLSSVAMAAERGIAEQLAEQQRTGELDEFVLGLTRFLAYHRSDSTKALVVVELPRNQRPGDRLLVPKDLPAATRLHLLEEAIRAQSEAGEAPW